MKGIQNIICARKSFYQNKMNHFLSWTNSKSGMNGTNEREIRSMLTQILKELMIPSTIVNHIISCVYSYDFDASRLVNQIKKNSTKFDLFHKEKKVVEESVNAVLITIQVLRVNITSLNEVQKAGLCIFCQLILQGARNEFDGFGTSEDLIKEWKKAENMKKIKENEKIEKERKEMERLKFEEEKKIYEEKKEEEEIFKQNEEDIPDSWDD